MPSYTSKDTRTLKLQKADKPKIGHGLPPSGDGFEGENRIQIVNGSPRLYYRTNKQWYFTGLVQDGAVPDVPIATSTQLGVIKIGSGGTISSDGTYTATAATPPADDISGGDAAVTISTSSGAITIGPGGSNANVLVKGNDGGSEITALTFDMANAGAATFNDKIVATELDISGNVDIDGTLETDALTINGTTLAETIADTVGAMVSSNTESGITVAYQDSDNTLDFTVGTLNQNTTGNAATATALETARNIGGVSFDGTANIVPSTVVVSDSTANSNYPVVFHNESNGLLDDTGALRYNPSSGTLLVPSITISGLSEQASEATAVMINGSNVVGWRELGSAAFAGTSDFMASDADANMASVTGTLAVGNGGTGATTLNNLITLSTHTTGNYVATISAGDGIDVSGSGSEGAGVTITAEDSTASNKGAVIVAGGTNCTVSYSSGTATVNVSTSAYKLFDDVETVALGGTGASSLTSNAVLTGNGSSAITAEGNLSFDGSTLAVTGAATVSSTLAVTSNITTDGIFKVDSAPDGNVIEFDQSGRRSAINVYFSSGSTGSKLVSRVSNGSTDNSMIDVLDLRPNQILSSNTGTASVPAYSFTDDTDIGMYRGAADTLRFATGGAERLEITDSQTKVTGIFKATSTIRGDADVVAYYSSDPSLKENKELIQSPLDKISQLGGYSFDWKEEAKDIVGDHLNGKDYGVMADEVQALFPELVDTRSNGIRAVKYDKLVPLLIEGIKELKEELNMIKEQS
jgi:hypothetical protein